MHTIKYISILNQFTSIYLCIYQPPLDKQDATQSQFLSGVLNSEFSFSYTSCHAKVKYLSLPYNP